MRFGFFVVLFLLVQSVLADSETVKTENSFSQKQVKEIEGLIIKTLQKNPDLIAKTLRTFIRKEEEKAKKEEAIALAKTQKKLNEKPTRLRLLDIKTAICEGDQEANRKLVIFSDSNCGHCRHLVLRLQELQNKYPQAMTILHRPYPLMPPESNEISAAVIAVAHVDNDKFKELNEMISKAEDLVLLKDIQKFIQSMGLNWEEILAGSASPEIQEIVVKNHKLGQDIGLEGTPMVIFYDEEKGSCRVIENFDEDLESIFAGA